MIVVYRPATAFFVELPRVRSAMHWSESDRHVDLFYFVVIFASLMLPLHWLMMAQFAWWNSPEYFRRYGVIIRRMEALDACTEVIGHYRGAPVYRSVAFKRMEYEFARVVSPRYQARIDENELYLDPGLLYVFSRVSPVHTLHARGASNGLRLILP
jgi:hypothetical protein